MDPILKYITINAEASQFAFLKSYTLIISDKSEL